MHVSNDPGGWGIVFPSKTLQGIRQEDLGANSIPWIFIVGLPSIIRLEIVPSPHPISRTEAPDGILEARDSARTRTRLPKTARSWARFKTLRASEPCNSFVIF